jgi:hypothetical protein
MVRRPVPVAEVVPRTAPVIAFGDPCRAKVATLGINPSRREFVEDGHLRTGPKRRLATLESLDAESSVSPPGIRQVESHSVVGEHKTDEWQQREGWPA